MKVRFQRPPNDGQVDIYDMDELEYKDFVDMLKQFSRSSQYYPFPDQKLIEVANELLRELGED